MARLLSHERYLRQLNALVAKADLVDKPEIARLGKHLEHWESCSECLLEGRRHWLPAGEEQLLALCRSERWTTRFSGRLLQQIVRCIQQKRHAQESLRERERQSEVQARLLDDFWEHPEKYWKPFTNPTPSSHMSDEEIHGVMDRHGVPNFEIGCTDFLLWEPSEQWPPEVEGYVFPC